MAQKYYNSKDAAKVLGVSDDEVKQMLDRKELRGFRDGADWKFKSEDIDQLAKQRGPGKASEGDDVLLSEVELGQSDPGTSGTVIAMNWVDRGVTDSDIRLADSDISLSESSRLSESSKTPIPGKKGDSDAKGKKFEELDLALEQDLTLKGSSPALPGAKAGPPKPGSSVIDLAGDSPVGKAGSKSGVKPGSSSDLVLGGPEPGSDVSLGGDSGISLVDPSDSGLSLEQPVLDLGGKGEESLELGEDDLLVAEDSPAPVKTDNEFLLSPLEETTDTQESSSESGSQVIALDTEATEAGMLGGVEGMAAIDIDTAFAGQPGLGGPSLAAESGALVEGAPLIQAGAVLPEAPYTWWQISGLAVCLLLLMLCGMMMYDTLRHMWSWGEPYAVNSSLMDSILSLFEGK
jgi:excisionase family DNA binding protein